MVGPLAGGLTLTGDHSGGDDPALQHVLGRSSSDGHVADEVARWRAHAAAALTKESSNDAQAPAHPSGGRSEDLPRSMRERARSATGTRIPEHARPSGGDASEMRLAAS